ncbi:predicted protein [Lichtheimia corymbifera JMRC:FSU:9682]|uniref:F-box domain-containing protein n=1 Tax=Lichtheimia corymbifera JMRC:FSU:9682 TaxID=1263082 RepID=A0A068RXD2_9FUNG|nr:predicted protein [Lichtheimia corymbifera JMRC:FSU:9682]
MGSRWELQDGHVVPQAHHRRNVPSLRPDDDPTQTKTVFTRLADIAITDYLPSPSHGLMIWLISNATDLRGIHLPESHFLSDVSKTMIKVSHLSKLEITRIAGTAEFCDPIVSFMQHHIAMEDQSTLEELILHIDDGKMHEVTWLDMVSQMKCLKNLELLAGSIPEDCLPVLEKIGQDCSSLESVTLGKRHDRGSSLADGVIRSFSRHPNLKYLTVEAKSLSATDILAFTTLPRLERLRLNYYTPDWIKDMLAELVPNVIIQTIYT